MGHRGWSFHGPREQAKARCILHLMRDDMQNCNGSLIDAFHRNCLGGAWHPRDLIEGRRGASREEHGAVLSSQCARLDRIHNVAGIVAHAPQSGPGAATTSSAQSLFVDAPSCDREDIGDSAIGDWGSGVSKAAQLIDLVLDGAHPSLLPPGVPHPERVGEEPTHDESVQQRNALVVEDPNSSSITCASGGSVSINNTTVAEKAVSSGDGDDDIKGAPEVAGVNNSCCCCCYFLGLGVVLYLEQETWRR
jgi:hypothetical protein